MNRNFILSMYLIEVNDNNGCHCEERSDEAIP